MKLRVGYYLPQFWYPESIPKSNPYLWTMKSKKLKLRSNQEGISF
jgi:hypothetical protein